MKKITLIVVALFTGYLLTAQTNLITNGDFEGEEDVWIGNAANIQTENGNSFNFANVTAAGNPFDVNLSQVVTIEQGATYTLVFDASSDRERTMLAGIGLNVNPFTNTSQSVDLTTETQTFTLTLSATDFGGAQSRVLFDMGAAVGVVVIDNVVLTKNDTGGGNTGGGATGEELITNGDFEGEEEVWIGNAANIQTEGGNSFNFADVTAAGNPFDVNLSQVVTIEQGATYTLVFDASSDRERTMLAGIGLNVNPFTNTSQSVDLTTETQTFTLTLSATDFGGAQSRVLFDMGAAVGVVVIDNVSLKKNESNGSGTGTGEEIVINGDFESGATPWIGNAANVLTEGGNSFNFADVTAAGNAFDVNLSQVLTIEQGATYTMTFDASSDRNRTMLAGIGQNAAPFNADVQSVSLTDATQTFTLTLNASNFGDSNCRVIFDMGADVGVVVIDNVSLKKNESTGGGTAAVPTTSAPTPPTRNQEDYFSIYSDAYNDQENVVFGAFGAGATNIMTETISQDNFLKIEFVQPTAQFLLVDWGTTVDASQMTNFHFDYWTDTSLKEGLIVNPKWSNHDGNDGETAAFEFNNPANTFGQWVSVDIPIATMTSINGTNQPRNALRQFIITVAGAATGSRTAYIDNVYLYKSATASSSDKSIANLTVFPNPSNDQWSITTGSENIQSIDVYDLTGKQLFNSKPTGTQAIINGRSLASGIYLARISTNQGQETIKLIKQ